MRAKALRGSLAGSFATSIAIQGLTALTGVLLARQLGPHGRGVLAGILIWSGLLTLIGSLGMSDSVTYHAARERRLGALIGTTAALCLAQSIVLVSVGWFVLPLVLHGYGPSTVHTAQAFLAYMPLFLLNMYAMCILQGVGRFAAYQFVRLLQIVLVTASCLTLVLVHGLTIDRVLAVYVGAYGVCLCVSITLVLRYPLDRVHVELGLARRLLSFAVRSHSGNVSAMFNERLDQLLISVFLAPAQLGLYVVAVTFTSLSTLVGTSVGIVALPTVAAAHALAQPLLVRRYIRLTAFTAAVVTVPVIVFAPQFIRVFFGADFLGATTACRILLVASVVLTVARLLGVLLKGIGRPLDAGIAEFVALGVTVVLLVALLPLLGITGAAIASLAAYSVSAAWSLRRLCRATGLALRDFVSAANPLWKEAARPAGEAS
jgi:O-antigen/teichoic acid export membrane protein